MAERTCSIEGCDTKVHARGWCGAHYNRWLYGKTMVDPSPEERFWSKVNKTDDCWFWTDALNPKGYGHFKVAGRMFAAHRYAYELVVGPIPEGLVIDHLCRVPACVNPTHMEPVTIGENTRRGLQPFVAARRQRAKTHCPQGHPYDDENTRWYQGRRYCRACLDLRTLKKSAERRARRELKLGELT